MDEHLKSKCTESDFFNDNKANLKINVCVCVCVERIRERQSMRDRDKERDRETKKDLLYLFIYLFLAAPCHVEVLGPGIELLLQQLPKPQQ